MRKWTDQGRRRLEGVSAFADSRRDYLLEFEFLKSKKFQRGGFMATEKRSTLNKELLFLILQFCNDEGYTRTAHMLERESGCYFDMEFVEDMVHTGKWDKVEKYLSGFTNVDSNKYSTKIYFEIRKQNFLEALDNNDRAKALDILMKDLKVFAAGNEELFREMTQLLTLDDFREHESLSMYGDVESSRKVLMDEIKKLIEANPNFHGKLKFPSIKSQRLRRLINQGLNWQHIQCKYPQPNPDVNTLFEDHVCQWQQNHLFMQSTENLVPSQDASVPDFPASWISGPSALTHAVSNEDMYLSGPITLATTSNNIGDSHTMSQKSLLGTEDEVTSAIPHLGRNHSRSPNIFDDLSIISMNNDMLQNIVPISHPDLPKTVARILNEVNSPMSMEFHPVYQTFLLVGTNIGDIVLWDVNSGEKLLSRNFMVWNIGACSMIFKTAMMKDPCMSVNRVAWSPTGSLFGVAYSKHIVQLYSYLGDTDVQQKLEIDAHVGGVNDLAFSTPQKQLMVITGGDDKIIKVWDAITGVQMHNLEGHEAPVYSLCPHYKEDIHFGLTKDKFLAAADDHVIKIWDMDKVELLTTIDAEGGLPANPHIRFNKEGTLLAVAANENKIKILAADYGLQLLNALEKDFVDMSSDVSDALRKLVINPSSTVASSGEADGEVPSNCNEESFKDVNNKFMDNINNKTDVWKIVQINRPSQCQSLQLSGHGKADKISRLIYTNAGNAILALASNATHLLWKWPQNDLNLSGKATTNVPPQLWQPRSCSQPMTNDLTGRKLEEAVPCLALSKNNSYLLSASGGTISLFNMLTFKTMMSIMPPSPATTSLAFHPQDNNIVAIGMDDCTILIYNIKSRLKGHSGKVTGLAFSKTMNVLVSSGADAQIFTWNPDGWEKCKSKSLQLPDERMPVLESNTQVQFHLDQIHFLVVHETQLSIHEANDLTCVQQWVPEDSTRISQATYSCDSQMVYACFTDGTVAIFGASDLELKCQIIPTAYLPTSARLNVYPFAIAAHPQKSTQFAVGLTDGGVIVLEPPQHGKTWYVGENGSAIANGMLEE
ncbi:WD40 repeat - like 10 [Theobroma cacao]|nr:WD40 repeat - like 10 [Theobroma cacao]